MFDDFVTQIQSDELRYPFGAFDVGDLKDLFEDDESPLPLMDELFS